MLYQLENLCLRKALLMLKSFSGGDENDIVCGLKACDLRCVIPLLKVDSGRPLVIEIRAGFSAPGCFSEL